MKEPTVENKYTETTQVVSFSVKFEYNTYRVVVSLDDSFGEAYLEGIYISREDGLVNEQKQLFVFDLSHMEHLQLAAKIHEKVCELLEKQPKPVRRASKASGKRT